MLQEKKKLCFVLMPFKEKMKEVYNDAIKPAIEQAGFSSLRVDELKGQFNINRKIIEYIFSSDAIVADLTNWNPNVFYEMGVAHAIDNKTIMIIQKKKKLPFDVSNYKCIQYEQTSSGLEKLKSQICDHLECFDDWRKEPTNPVQDFKPHDAFIPRGDLILIQRKLNQAEKRLKKAIDYQQYEVKIREIETLKKELENARQLQKAVGRKEQDFLKYFQSLSDEKNVAQKKAAEPAQETKILKTVLQQARHELKEILEQASAMPTVTSLFRNKPTALSEVDVKTMLKKYDFYCGENHLSKNYCNPKGKGFKHHFEVKTIEGDKVVFDQASGLVWQQSGSSDYEFYDFAKQYIKRLNLRGCAGYNNWRLPTLEEAMTLIESEIKIDLYINPIFDATQTWIWTADSVQGELQMWVVNFDDGSCVLSYGFDNNGYIRAVRSEQLTKTNLNI